MNLEPLTPAPTPWRRWRLVVVVLVLTLGVVMIDLARPALLDPVRSAAGRLSAPVTSTIAGWADTRVTELTRERNALAAQVAELQAQIDTHEDLRTLERTATWGHAELLPARVVGFASDSAPMGERSITIDAGRRDGVRVDQSVIDVNGVIGRVVRVEERSADVLLLGDSGVVVGVRFGEAGALGSVEASPPQAHRLPARGPGELTLTGLGTHPIAVGDVVTTLGSPDSTPYAAGLPLGEVVSVDPPSGGLTPTASVRPYMDADTLDLVAVIFPLGEGE